MENKKFWMKCFVLPLKAKLNQPLILKVREWDIPNVRASFPKAAIADYQREGIGCGPLDLSSTAIAKSKQPLKEVILN